MTVLLVMVIAAVVLILAGRFYSRFLARQIGEDPSRPTPAVEKNDGQDYVPTPTAVVFAHHFASIAGAGPILGPVIAIIYGWVPALLWVLIGGVAIGAVHDYLATYMATREGGQSIATVARRMIGKGAFVALTVLLIVMLALVCATFLNASAKALTSTVPFDRLDLPQDQQLFRVERGEVVIGGIASMSVVCITAVAPLIGYLYLKRKLAVWKCSLLAIAICAASITTGLFWPMPLPPLAWQLALSVYVLLAAGLPVWIFLQSRDFINVHILYVGMAVLLVMLVVVGIRGGGPHVAQFESNLLSKRSAPEAVRLITDDRAQEEPARGPEWADPIPAVNIAEGTRTQGIFWPTMFIVIACGAVSGFHSLCAGGTTCKQLSSEADCRRIGYYGMLLESFLAVCVIAVLMVGAGKMNYLVDVHPGFLAKAYPGYVEQQGLTLGDPNWVLGFAMAVGNAARFAFGLPIAVGALAGMILLEGFLVTTLDTAIRLTRYLIEEVWRTLFGRFDVFAAPVGQKELQEWGKGERAPVGAEGIPIAPPTQETARAPAFPTATMGLRRWVLTLLRQYWFNSAIAVGLMLVFALTGALGALWNIFATSNQLLAAMVLLLASLWLLRHGRRIWFAFIPALLMLATTATNLVLMLLSFLKKPKANAVLLTADIVIAAITLYLLIAGAFAVAAFLRNRRAAGASGAGRGGP